MDLSPWSTRHHRCVMTNISNFFGFSETKRINLKNIDTWLVKTFSYGILKLEMATNQSFEIGVQISQNSISKWRTVTSPMSKKSTSGCSE